MCLSNKTQKCQNSNDSVITVKMADAATARRELRRRRILENSSNRLQVIAGIGSDDLDRVSSIRSYPSKENFDALVEETVSDSGYSSRSFVNGGPSTEPDLFEEIPPIGNDTVGSGDRDETESGYMSARPRGPVVKAAPEWEYVLLYKYDVVILSLFVQLLHLVESVIQFQFTYTFAPIAYYALLKCWWYPAKEEAGFANALLLLNGISASKVQNIIWVGRVLKMLAQDISIYLFTTICTQCILIKLFEFGALHAGK